MDISSATLVNPAPQLQQSQVTQTIQFLVLKKAMNSQPTGAMVRLSALPMATNDEPQRPSHSGGAICWTVGCDSALSTQWHECP